MRWLLGFCLACWLGTFDRVSADDTPPKTTPPNIVFLLVDDLGYGDFGCYGAEFYETPHIDKLAAQAMRFTNSYAACTVCSPSRAAILSGCYPARLHLTDWIAGHNHPHAKLSIPDWNMRLEHERVLLPEALGQAGYQTAFVGKWHLMPNGQPDFDDHYPTAHGFDVNIGGREWGQPKGRGKYFSPFDMPGLDDGEPGDFLTDNLTDAAVDFINDRDPNRPFLLYFSYYTIHGPIMAKPELVAKYREKAKVFENHKEEFINPKRAGMIESLDDSVGRLMRLLESLGIAENTIVVLTGDNGGDHDKTTAGLRDFKGYSHEGGVREPCLIKWPGKVQPASTSEAVITGTDFYPTLLEAAGLPPRPSEHVDGQSLVPILTGNARSLSRESVYWHYPHYHRTKPYGAIRTGNWKLIEFFEDGSLELFDLESDPNETTNLAEREPKRTQEMRKNLVAWRESVAAQMMLPNPNFDPNKPGRGSRIRRK